MKVFNQDGKDTLYPIGIGLCLNDLKMVHELDIDVDNRFSVTVYDIDHYVKLFCKISYVFQNRGYYKVIYKVIQTVKAKVTFSDITSKIGIDNIEQ